MDHDKIIESYIKETSERLKTKQRTLLIDDTPTEGSDNPVTSDGIKKYMDAKPSGGTEIEINTGQATDVLTGLQIDGDKYQVEEATTVEANGDVGDNYSYIASLTVNSNEYSFPKAPLDMDTSCDSVNVQVNQYGSTWSQKTWNGLTNFYNSYIWTDGENIYYSNNSNQYVLDRATSTWSQKTWNGLTRVNGNNIWTDGENVYYSNQSSQYVLNKATSTWSQKTWNGLTEFYGSEIWTDGENIYYSDNSSVHYVLDKTTSTWSSKTWSGLTNFSGNDIWADGENIYWSGGSEHYVLDKTTSTWRPKTWNGLTNFFSSNIWTDGENIYYSTWENNCVLDKTTSTWTSKTWSGINLSNFYGALIWTDGENIYYSSGSTQYVLNKNSLHSVKTHLTRANDIKINTASSSTQTLQNFVYKNIRYEIKQLQPSSNVPVSNTKTESETFQSAWEMIEGPSFSWYRDSIWTDGENIYYSNYSDQYVLNKTTSTWIPKTWNGYTSVFALYIWTDGENIYYSSGSKQYVLDRATSTWTSKTWSGLTSFNGGGVWTDGETIYYSNNSDQYVLNKGTSTWTRKTWSGLTSFNGGGVWTDGDNIYYSYYAFSSQQYVLDKTTSTWTQKTWYGIDLKELAGYKIWTDGENIYCSWDSDDLNKQYILDKASSTWSEKAWSGLTEFDAFYVWTDGENIYCKGDYKLKKNTLLGVDRLSQKVIPNNDNAVASSASLTSVSIDGVPYRIGFNEYILLVQNLEHNGSAVIQWNAPSLDYFSNNATLSYLISVNGTFVAETQNTTYDLSGHLVSGDNTISITTKISTIGQQGNTIEVVK